MMRPKTKRGLVRTFAVLILLTILTLFAAFGIHAVQMSNTQPPTPSAAEVVMY